MREINNTKFPIEQKKSGPTNLIEIYSSLLAEFFIST